MSSPSLTSYKRPNLGEMAEAPDLKKVHALTGQSVPAEWAHWRPKPADTISANTVDQEFYGEHSEAAALQVMCDLEDMIAEEILVPDKMVGLIIGRGGDVISRLQMESGAKIQMAPDGLGLAERTCTVTGTKAAIEVAKAMIERIITNETMKAMSKVGQAPTHVHEMMIPGNLVARVIGKGGEVIKAMQEESGAKIVIIQENKDYATEKPMRISGSIEVVEAARQKVEQVLAVEQQKLEVIKRGWTTNNNHFGYVSCLDTSALDITEVLSIPSSKVGLVMGRGGETIREICLVSGAHCQVDKTAPEGAREKNILIKGRPEAVERAKMMVTDRVGGVFDRGSGASVLPDYSMQWAEYYRSLGMLKEAEIIEQQMMAARSQSSSGPQPDYSAQWADYYRALGKVNEAEAIEATMKMKAFTDVSQSKPVFSTDLNLFNQGQGRTLSNWDAKM